jgi:hypothetical protein
VPVIGLAEVCGQRIVIQRPCDEQVLDSKGANGCRQELESLKDRLEVAKHTGNIDQASSLETELAELERHVRKTQAYVSNWVLNTAIFH